MATNPPFKEIFWEPLLHRHQHLYHRGFPSPVILSSAPVNSHACPFPPSWSNLSLTTGAGRILLSKASRSSIQAG